MAIHKKLKGKSSFIRGQTRATSIKQGRLGRELSYLI